MPSRDFTSEDLFSSRMMSMHSSTHSSQMKTVGPAINLRTSCWLLPQNEQYSVFLESLVPTLLILVSVRRSTSSAQSLHLRNSRHGDVDRANSVPKKTLCLHTLRITVYSNLPRSYPITRSQPCWHPTIKNSLTGRHASIRDNTVICGFGTR